MYRLYAIIVHEGYSTSSGHYYTFIKNQENHHWYKYDDDVVKHVGPDLNGVKKFTQNAYILFYKKFYSDQMDHPTESISRSRSPSFYQQQKEKGLDLFEQVSPTDERMVN